MRCIYCICFSKFLARGISLPRNGPMKFMRPLERRRPGPLRRRGCDQGWRLKSRELKPETDLSIHVTGVKKCEKKVHPGNWLENGERGLGEMGLFMDLESSPDLQGSRADETSFHLARWITSRILFCRNTFGSWDHPESIGKHLQTIERGLAPPWLGFSVLTHLESMTISFKVTLTLGLHQLSTSHHGTMPSPGILTGKLQVRCPEEGCPPVETVITDLSVKAPKPGAGRCLWWVFVQPGVDHLAA